MEPVNSVSPQVNNMQYITQLVITDNKKATGYA
jgi:hypothetical protein